MAYDPTEFNALLGSQDNGVDTYIESLLSEAKGDLNLALGNLEHTFDIALGTDDTAAQNFILSVADTLEQKIGRIPYDYQKMTSREIEDYARSTERTNTTTSKLLTRLKEDEDLNRADMQARQEQERALQGEDLNARGISEGMTRRNARGLAGKEVGTLESDISRRNTAFDRLASRNQEDVLYNQKLALEDALTAKNRNTEDLTTAARRGALDSSYARTYGTQVAQNSFNKTKAQLERERQLQKLYTPASSVTYTS